MTMLIFENTKSRKILLITTNEWSIKEWDIENHVDEVIFTAKRKITPNSLQI